MNYQIGDTVHYMFGHKIYPAVVIGIKMTTEIIGTDDNKYPPKVFTSYRYSVRDVNSGGYRFDYEAANFETAAEILQGQLAKEVAIRSNNRDNY